MISTSSPIEMKRNFAFHLKAGAALRKVLSAFERERIDVLVVKGASTAHLLYEHPSERLISDVDLLFDPSDHARIRHIVFQNGWRLARDVPKLHEFECVVDGVQIDMKGVVGPPGLCLVTVRDMMGRSETVGAASFRSPELHDHVLVLCMTLFRDMFDRTNRATVDDLERIVGRRDFSEERFIRLIAAGGVKTAVWMVADWMARERSSARWAVLRDAIGDPKRPIYGWIFERTRKRCVGVGSRGHRFRVLATGAERRKFRSLPILIMTLIAPATWTKLRGRQDERPWNQRRRKVSRTVRTTGAKLFVFLAVFFGRCTSGWSGSALTHRILLVGVPRTRDASRMIRLFEAYRNEFASHDIDVITSPDLSTYFNARGWFRQVSSSRYGSVEFKLWVPALRRRYDRVILLDVGSCPDSFWGAIRWLGA